MKPHIVKLEYLPQSLDLFDFVRDINDAMDIYYEDSFKRENIKDTVWFEKYCVDYLEAHNVIILRGNSSLGYFGFNINGINFIISLNERDFYGYELDSLSRLFLYVNLYKRVK